MSKIPIWMLLSVILLSILIVPTVAVEPPPERDVFTVAILGDRTGGKPGGWNSSSELFMKSISSIPIS